jgi:cullin-associated NEDD8-dissociated protein 1
VEIDDVAKQLYTAIEPLLGAHDADQEIKECALTACAALWSALHSSLTPEQTTQLLTLLLERLKNETTRIAAIKTLRSIAASDNNYLDEIDKEKIDLSPILADSIQTSFLKVQSRSLKQSWLEALDTVVTNHGILDSKDLYSTVLQELSHLVVDSDLHISHLA